MSRIERVSYRSGFVKRLRESRHLPAITFEAGDLPEDVLPLLDPSSTSAAPMATPRLEITSSTTSYASSTTRATWRSSSTERAILLVTTESDAVKRIHQVCYRLDDLAGSRRPT